MQPLHTLRNIGLMLQLLSAFLRGFKVLQLLQPPLQRGFLKLLNAFLRRFRVLDALLGRGRSIGGLLLLCDALLRVIVIAAAIERLEAWSPSAFVSVRYRND